MFHLIHTLQVCYELAMFASVIRSRLRSNLVPAFVRTHATATTTTTTSSLPPDATTRRSRTDIQKIYDSPLLDLVYRAASVHRSHHDPSKIQLCTLMNIKSMCSFAQSFMQLTLSPSPLAGGCSEDCKTTILWPD